MIKVTIQYTEDEEMIETHCLRDEIENMLSDSQVPEMIENFNIKVLNPEGEEEHKYD